MKQLIILTCLFMGTTLFAQTVNPIQEAMSNYDYETALLLIEKESPSAQLTFQKALALKGLSRYSEALGSFSKVAKAEPENLRARIELAECYKSLGKFNEALINYEKVLEINPDNKYVILQKITLLYNLERFRAGKEACVKALENNENGAILRLMAQCYEGMMRSDSAIVTYHRAIDVDPNDYFSVAKLSSLYINTLLPDMAVEITENYRKRDTTNLYVNRQNAQALCLIKEYPKAIQRYNVLVQQGDSTFMTCYYLGMSYFADQKYYDAHDFLNIAYKYKPDDVNVLYYLAKACSKTSWKPRAVTLMDEAIDLTIPGDTTLIKLYSALAECCESATNFRKYIETCREQYKYDKSNHILLYNIARAYQYGLKDVKGAERYLTMFLKTKPKEEKNNPEALNEKGEIVLGRRNYYNAAERWLEDIRKEKFFKEGAENKQGTEKKP